jgi:hypothetical protein
MASSAPMRAIQEWMGHRDSRTSSLYADPNRPCDGPECSLPTRVPSWGRGDLRSVLPTVLPN